MIERHIYHAGARHHGDHAPIEAPKDTRLVVLIAEDEKPIAEALALIIEDAGYTPLIAIHGREALALSRAMPPALVLTDLMMPHLNGIDLIAALRADASHNGAAPPAFVLMTAAPPPRAEDVGADAVLRKPFDIAEVEQLLSRFLDPPGEPHA